MAIGIPQPWGAQLDAHRAATGDPAAALIPSHITLLGPTLIGPEDIDEHLEKVARTQPPFSIHLRGTGTFRPVSRVVFVAVAAGISECERLAEAVRSGPLERELAHPYHPHVTVAHDIAEEAMDAVYERLAGYDARFDVDHFTRYEHGEDGHWRPIRHFPLSGQPG
ncbi:2'-5' RNA ligase family protein [Allorhizocola rhizosphaerae]|uniref:2'-5' RNA ligase family protein n=1 Tax=Allorhizocola rhizosphaerae TaxID=1872709 RepID=UPI001FE441DF|nr:2'-5' RNA ligase family protein [Allorhizocola rhizosphaerae]